MLKTSLSFTIFPGNGTNYVLNPYRKQKLLLLLFLLCIQTPFPATRKQINNYLIPFHISFEVLS